MEVCIPSYGVILSVVLCTFVSKGTDAAVHTKFGKRREISWDEIVAPFLSLLNVTFKTNPYLERAIMTGVTRVPKDIISSDLIHFEIITTTSSRYDDSFGFTEAEVFAALDEKGISPERIRKYGFAFEGKEVLIGC